jgi:hypothetical protein
MQSSISKEITGTKGYNDYVNQVGHPTNAHYSFERVPSNNTSGHMYGWNTDVPAWDIKCTSDGFHSECCWLCSLLFLWMQVKQQSRQLVLLISLLLMMILIKPLLLL